MLKYNFAIAVNRNAVTKEQRRERVFQVEPPYDMLSNLSYGCQDVQFVKEVIQSLKMLLSEKQGEYGYWGYDMTYVMSYPEKSVVTYTHVNDKNEILDSDIEIPTSWLLQLMEEWLVFLEKEEDDSDTVVHGLWIPPSS